ncbi:glycoprotein-N-acetylgalactosamine 3-beta-galactosyltransferase 1 [Drosophila tropicalis]|uniref:glycoprotein-N-acetylgalactosamine 3-beta-galactosyltransferase 1 n=1 Tax=Drosophila tropicalis TaxID=46794 RepID=UPI0035AB8B8C
MPRFFSTRNKISICHPLNILWLCILCLVFLFTLHQDAATKRLVSLESPSAPSPRIFCVIVTYAYRHHIAFHIYHTWVNQCDKYLFVSDDSHEVLEPAVFQNLPDKWQRMRAQMDYLYKYHINEGDWFLFSNDDNFVIVDNLRLMVQTYSSDELIYFGCKLKNPQEQPYMLESSVMVLSHSALKRFAVDALPNEDLCSSKSLGNAAYEEFGRCLSNVHVIAGDSRDNNKLHRFLPFETSVHLGYEPLNASLENHKYFIDRSFDGVQNLKLPVSPISISYHMDSMDRTYDLYYFIKNVKIFGFARKLIPALPNTERND